MSERSTIRLYKEWLCTQCGEVSEHSRKLPRSGKPKRCPKCYPAPDKSRLVCSACGKPWTNEHPCGDVGIEPIRVDGVGSTWGLSGNVRILPRRPGGQTEEGGGRE